MAQAMITLRDYTQDDIEQLVALANNNNVSRYMVATFPYPYTRSDALAWISTDSRADGSITKVIEYQGQFVGSIGIHPQAGWKSHSAEIGYWIGEPYWGQGLATAALAQMTEQVFADLKYKKLFAPVLGPNQASRRVLEKCAFQLEGVFKQEVYKDGTYFDVHHYAKYNP